jgi:hypothetical protein
MVSRLNIPCSVSYSYDDVRPNISGSGLIYHRDRGTEIEEEGRFRAVFLLTDSCGPSNLRLFLARIPFDPNYGLCWW